MKKCKNCEETVTGHYCAACGQKWKFSVDPKLKDLWHEAFHEFVHLDSKIYRTLWALFRHPGLLTYEFLRGRHASYVGPVRLYLTLSILYFLVSAMLPGGLTSSAYTFNDGKTKSAAPNQGAAPAFEVTDIKMDVTGVSPGFKETVKRGVKVAAGDKSKFASSFQNTLAKALFGLLPVLAGLVWISYFRKRKNYPQYLYFALHYQSALFGGLILVMLSRQLPLFAFAGVYVLWTAWAFAYLSLALTRVWKDARHRAILRAIFVFFFYTFFIVLTVLGVIIYVLYQIGKAVPLN